MLPLYFGSSSARLFGVYHPAGSARPRQSGVVLCPPAGHEYIRAHRSLRQLAERLSGAGFHVMRFDYFGCGDSAGEAEDASLTTWIGDIGAAVEELQDTAGVRRVCLVGLRLGATLAAHAAEDRSDVDAVVLWDPVVSGREYLDGLRRLQQQWLHDRPGSRRFAFSRHVPEVIGFPLTERMRHGLEAMDLRALRRTSLRRIVVRSPQEQGAHKEWVVTTGTAVPSELDLQGLPAGDWHRPELVHTALLAPRMVQRVAGLVEEHAS
jgi:alpha-beta hydrolase superfamily lysophospholipase